MLFLFPPPSRSHTAALSLNALLLRLFVCSRINPSLPSPRPPFCCDPSCRLVIVCRLRFSAPVYFYSYYTLLLCSVVVVVVRLWVVFIVSRRRFNSCFSACPGLILILILALALVGLILKHLIVLTVPQPPLPSSWPSPALALALAQPSSPSTISFFCFLIFPIRLPPAHPFFSLRFFVVFFPCLSLSLSLCVCRG